MAKNYYLILGLDSDATQEQIRSAYREKAKQSHPDHSGEDSEPFLAVQEAYNVLSDPKRRRAYDRRRQAPRRRGWTKSRWPQSRPSSVESFMSPEPGRWPATAFESLFAPFPDSLADRFDRLWRGYNPRGERLTGRQFDAEVALTPDEACHGCRLQLVIPARVRCRACRGRGRRGLYGCRYCSATGFITEEQSLLITVPAGIAEGDTGRVALDEFGYPNTALVLHFSINS